MSTPWFGWSKEGVHILTFPSDRMAQDAMAHKRVTAICTAITIPHLCLMNGRAIRRVCHGSAGK
jgi:hypothetical protein